MPPLSITFCTLVRELLSEGFDRAVLQEAVPLVRERVAMLDARSRFVAPPVFDFYYFYFLIAKNDQDLPLALKILQRWRAEVFARGRPGHWLRTSTASSRRWPVSRRTGSCLNSSE